MTNVTTLSESENVERFLEAAKNLFCEGNEGMRESSKYIEVYAKLGKGRLPGADNPFYTGLMPLPPIVDPIEFLVGNIDKGPAAYLTEEEMPERSVAFVVGQYGLGKTELLFQIVKQSEQEGKKENFKNGILPINLVFCRKRLDRLKSNVSARELLILLFSHILIERDHDIEFVISEIVPRIYSGEIILLLDGLDELIVNDQESHRDFLAGLVYAFTESGTADDLPPRLRIVVSARLEYLSVVTEPGATDVAFHLNRRLGDDRKVEVYFLLLDLFESSRIKTYIEHRLKEKGETVYKMVYQRAGVLNVLRRPILLRLFCDMAERKSVEELVAELEDYEDGAGLMERFVDFVKDDALLKKDERPLIEDTGYTWGKNELAYACLDLFEEGRDQLLVSDVRKILQRKDDANIAPATRGKGISREILSDEKVLLSVHKCPFLIMQKQENMGDEIEEKAVKFAHRIFLEFFTAKGMKLELDEYRDTDRRKKGDPFIAFDELVLNVDMRKFLKGSMGGDDDVVWFKETKRAYGLNDEDRDEWWNREELDFEQLDERRKTLLRSMTNPENPTQTQETEESIKWFLEMSKQWLHPRYLVPNYEAVTVYIWSHRWEAEAKNINTMFRDVLDKKLIEIDNILQEGPDPKGPPASSYELLIERILNIGNRLRYSWARLYAIARKDALPISEEKTRQRVRSILESILNLEYFE